MVRALDRKRRRKLDRRKINFSEHFLFKVCLTTVGIKHHKHHFSGHVLVLKSTKRELISRRKYYQHFLR
jgi:hypothetical protein